MPLFKTKYNDVEKAIKFIKKHGIWKYNLDKASTFFFGDKKFILAYYHEENDLYNKPSISILDREEIEKSLFEDVDFVTRFDSKILKYLSDDMKKNPRVRDRFPDQLKSFIERYNDRVDSCFRGNEIDNILHALLDPGYIKEGDHAERLNDYYWTVDKKQPMRIRTFNEGDLGLYWLFKDLYVDKNIPVEKWIGIYTGAIFHYIPDNQILTYVGGTEKNRDNKLMLSDLQVLVKLSDKLQDNRYAIDFVPINQNQVVRLHHTGEENIVEWFQNGYPQFNEFVPSQDEKIKVYAKEVAEQLKKGKKVLICAPEQKTKIMDIMKEALHTLSAKEANEISFCTQVVSAEHIKLMDFQLSGTEFEFEKQDYPEDLYVINVREDEKQIEQATKEEQASKTKPSDHELS